jgi:hypothetical protein
MQTVVYRPKPTYPFVAGLLLAVLLVSGALFGQADSTILQMVDTATTVINNPEAPQEGPYYAIGLGIVLLGFAAVTFGVFLFLCLVAVVILFLLGFLLSAGAISLAVLHGLQKRSASAGAKAFIYLSLPPLAAGIGWAATWLIVKILNFHVNNDYIALMGIGGGFLSGLLMAYGMIKCVGWVWEKIVLHTLAVNSGNIDPTNMNVD